MVELFIVGGVLLIISHFFLVKDNYGDSPLYPIVTLYLASYILMSIFAIIDLTNKLNEKDCSKYERVYDEIYRKIE